MIPDPSSLLLVLFVGLVSVVVAALVFIVGLAEPDAGSARRTRLRAAFVCALWLLVTGGLGASGVLRADAMPPRLPILLVVLTALSTWLVLSSYGRRLAFDLPIWLLIGSSVFRLPLELIMHRAYTEGLMPVQMSYSGRNFDILTGVFALIGAVIAYRGRLASGLIWAYNVIGLALLINVVTVAILSMPTPIRVFDNEPPNVWVMDFPFVWLPAVFVQVAWLGHLLIFRRLLGAGDREGGTDPAGTSPT